MNLPASFIDYTRALLGNEEYEKLAAALQQEPPVSIRINKLRMKEEGLSSLTDSSARFSFNKVPWASDGYYLDERLTFTFDPLFHAGCYYVQEASSMFVEQVLRQYVESPVVMLDLCAAPGGKSTHARSVLPEGSLLVANEVIRNRSQVLAENLTKWGHPDVVVTNNDPADFSALPSFFDVILTDVPCSGEGMFRKDPVAVEEWSPENVEICWQRQRRIIADIWPCLKPGGILIYSTCTYNSKEDEENVCWIQQEFGAELLPLEVQDEWNTRANPAKRFAWGKGGPAAGMSVRARPEASDPKLGLTLSRCGGCATPHCLPLREKHLAPAAQLLFRLRGSLCGCSARLRASCHATGWAHGRVAKRPFREKCRRASPGLFFRLHVLLAPLCAYPPRF